MQKGSYTNRLLSAATLAASGVFANATAHAAQQNVLMIIIDDLLPRLGCYGDDTVIAPNIDKLAEESTLFERAYCQYPICNASRASLLSGMRPDTTRIYGNNQPVHEELADVQVLNRYFKDQGFFTVGIGKVYHASTGPADGWSKPYFKTKWLDYVAPENRAIADVFFDRKKSRGLPPSIEAEDVPDNAYCDGKAAEEALKDIAYAAELDQPFFIIAGFRHPHLPWCAPKKYWDLYDRDALTLADNPYFPIGAPDIAIKKDVGELGGYEDIPRKHPLSEAEQRQSLHGYLACVSYADAQVGKLIAALKKHGLYDDTIIVLWGDHGYQLGDHKTWAKGVNWESSDRAPLLIRAPKLDAAHQRVHALVEFVDVYPTLCELVGLPVPAHCDGRSLLPFLKDPNHPSNLPAFSQLKKGKVMGRSMRTDRYRFTIWEVDQTRAIKGLELYDLQEDPEGNRNLAYLPEYAERVKQFQQMHRKRWPYGPTQHDEHNTQSTSKKEKPHDS